MAGQVPPGATVSAAMAQDMPPIPSVLLGTEMPVDAVIAGAGHWQVIGAAVSLIANHYSLPAAHVWKAVFQLNREHEAETGQDAFGRLLDRPSGVSILGLRVAELLIGKVEAAELPLVGAERPIGGIQ